MSLVRRTDPEVRDRRIAAAAFGATCASVLGCHLVWWRTANTWTAALGQAVLFTGALMAILGAHELGHWLAARRAGFHLSLPYFLPFPVVVGTMGALIGLRDRPPDRAALASMALGGPVAGVLAIVLVAGARLASGAPAEPEGLELAAPLLLRSVGVVAGFDVSSVDARDPLLFAAWIGCLVTALNMVPIGQLDGGHVAASVFPGRARSIRLMATCVLLGAGLLWPGWALWVALVWLVVSREPVAVRQPTARDVRWQAVVGVVVFVATVTPIPVSGVGASDSPLGHRLLGGCAGTRGL